MTISTGLLADHEYMIDGLGGLMEREWPGWYRAGGASARADLRERLRRDCLPLGIVAVLDGQMAGCCALTATSGGLPDLRMPWVGGLLVDPAYRRRGVGAALLERARTEARRLGHDHLYALTATADALFSHGGWRRDETITLDDTPHAIYTIATS